MMLSRINKIPDSIINKVRQTNDIVHIVGEYVQLKKQGRNYFGLCPFHDEKTPSFSVTEEKQIFHCFGCGKGGNVITFLMEIENFTFYEAIQHLAKRSGIKLPSNIQGQSESYSETEDTLLKASEWLTKYFHHILKYTEEGREGSEYFNKRGIKKNTIDQFQLGFAPFNSEVTIQFLKEKGFHEQSLVKLGIFNRTDQDDLTDPFRGRLIFPIKNHLGKAIAFGGRAVKNINPKYLNSPENELFHKGSILYNFDLAKQSIRKTNEVIVFEGYMDVITAYQAGITNCVATLGTALTEYQARLIGRYVDTVILCYDGDQAGRKATYDASLLLRKYRSNVKVAMMDEQLDPDDYIREYGGERFKEDVINQSYTFTKFYLEYKKGKYDLSVESERVTYLNVVIKHIATVESPIEREYYVQQLGDEFNLTLDTLNHEVNRYRQASQSSKSRDKSNNNRYTNNATHNLRQSELLPAFHNAERYLLGHMLMSSHVIEKVQTELGIDFNLDEHKIIATHLYALFEESEEIDISSLIDRLDNPNVRTLITQIINLPIDHNASDDEINDYINTIRLEHTTVSELNGLKRKQRQAIKENNPEVAIKLAEKIIEMERKLKQ